MVVDDTVEYKAGEGGDGDDTSRDLTQSVSVSEKDISSTSALMLVSMSISWLDV